MACPTCGSKNLNEGLNLDEKTCKDCGCVFRESNQTVFEEGSFAKICESVSQFLLDRIDNPTIRRELLTIVERFSNEGIESSDDLVRELNFIAESMEIAKGKESQVIKNSAKKVKRLYENCLAFGTMGLQPSLFVNPLSNDNIPPEPQIDDGQPSPEEQLANLPYGDQVLDEDGYEDSDIVDNFLDSFNELVRRTGGNVVLDPKYVSDDGENIKKEILKADILRGQVNGTSTSYDDYNNREETEKFTMFTSSDGVINDTESESELITYANNTEDAPTDLDEMMGGGAQENPVVSNYGLEPEAGLPYEDPYSDSLPSPEDEGELENLIQKDYDELENPELITHDEMETSFPHENDIEDIDIPTPEDEDQIMNEEKFNSVNQNVRQGDRIFLESERGVTYTVDRVRGNFADLISDEGVKSTVNLNETILHEAEDLDVAWEKKGASLDNLRKIYESLEEELDGIDEKKEKCEEEDISKEYLVNNSKYTERDEINEDDDDINWERSHETLLNTNEEYKLISELVDAVKNEDLENISNTLEIIDSDYRDWIVDEFNDANEMVSRKDEVVEYLDNILGKMQIDPNNYNYTDYTEGEAHDVYGNSDDTGHGFSSEDGMMEAEDYTEEGDEGSYSIEGKDKLEPDEDPDNVMNEEVYTQEGDDGDETGHNFSSDEGEGKAHGKAKTGAPNKSVEDAELESDGPETSHADDHDKKGDIWGAVELKETKEIYNFLNGKITKLMEWHLNDDIRAAWDTFSELGDKLADLEKSYEAEYEKMDHPEMVPADETDSDDDDDDDDDDDTEEGDKRKEELESEIQELQSQLEQLSESILQQFVHNSLGEPRNIGAPYVTERENGRFENTYPLPEKEREEGGHGEDEENGVYERLEVDDNGQAVLEYEKDERDEVDSEGYAQVPSEETELHHTKEYEEYGAVSHTAINESLRVGDLAYIRNRFDTKWQITSIKGSVVSLKSGKKTATINTLNEDIQLVEGKDLIIERNMEVVNNGRHLWEEVEKDIERSERKIMKESVDTEDELLDEEDEDEKELAESAQIYSYIKERDLHISDRSLALQELASKFSNNIGEIENIFEDACKSSDEMDDIYGFQTHDSGMGGIFESRNAWLQIEKDLKDDDVGPTGKFFHI